jgi:hypothetical protein
VRRLPREFADLLSPRGRSILNYGYAQARQVFRGRATPLVLLPAILDAGAASGCRRLLDRSLYDHVRRVDAPIPPETITGMRRNYAELLPKTMRFKTAYFGSRSSRAYRAASRIGLFDMMRSESLVRFAEAVTSLELKREPDVQAILYEPGDYAGPHNDHHPQCDSARHGFVDLHISLTGSGVSSQYLVCENGAHFSRMYSVARNGSVAVYLLPFWHYTTPLVAKRSARKDAHRWLLLASFDLAGRNRRSTRGGS